MSLNKSDDEGPSSRNLSESESPRKRARLDFSIRKSWSLTDRRTDHQVLQEMGVSLLEQDDMEPICDTPSNLARPSLKRKYDIENVNPNINSASPPRSKLSPKSPRTKFSPSPGPSKPRSPESSEKCKPLQPTEPNLLETTFLDEYLVDEETPSTQSISGQYRQDTGIKPAANSCTGGKRRSGNSFSSLVLEEEVIKKRRKSEGQGEDSFLILSDEMVLTIFRWLPKRTLVHCMSVCKRWYQIASDESLWHGLDLGNKVLSRGALGKILFRKPMIVRLAHSEIAEWHPTTPPSQSRIQYLDLSACTIDMITLNCLMERCQSLRKLSLESLIVNDETCRHIGKSTNMETLNLTMTQGITAEGLKFILEGCTSVQSLNISWCNLSEEALQVLVSALPQRLQRLNVGGARTMTDDMVCTLVDRCPRLLELDLSDCSRLGAKAVNAVQELNRLEHLALSRCYHLPPHTLTKLLRMPALRFLDVFGMLQTGSLNALKQALPGIQINQYMFSAIARPTVGTRRTSIWSLRTRD